MTNAMQIFNNPAFGEIRTMTIKGEPWAVGRDVAAALGYTNPRKALIDHVDAEDKGVTKRDTPGGEQEMTIINESGLYSLIFASKLPAAKEFKRWVTSEVLPAIRKTGGYSAKAVNAEARLLREQNRARKLDNDRLALELKSVKLYNASKGVDKATVAEVLRRNGISVPEETEKPAPESDIDFQAALEVLRRVGESAGTRKRHRNNEYLCIPAPEARDALNGQGFDPRAVFDFARNAGMLRTGKKGYSFTACINGLPVNCLWLSSTLMNA